MYIAIYRASCFMHGREQPPFCCDSPYLTGSDQGVSGGSCSTGDIRGPVMLCSSKYSHLGSGWPIGSQ